MPALRFPTATARARAWYQAALRCWDMAPVPASGLWPDNEQYGVLGDIRARIAARYVRLASVTTATKETP